MYFFRDLTLLIELREKIRFMEESYAACFHKFFCNKWRSKTEEERPNSGLSYKMAFKVEKIEVKIELI